MVQAKAKMFDEKIFSSNIFALAWTIGQCNVRHIERNTVMAECPLRKRGDKPFWVKQHLASLRLSLSMEHIEP